MNIELDMLNQQYFNLKSELSFLLDEWYYLNAIIQPRLVFTYESIFGELEFQLEELETHKINLERKLNFYSISRNGNSTNNSNSNKFVQSEIDTLSIYDNQLANNKDRFQIDYRDIVKKIHPDITKDTDLYQKYWNNIQLAYKNGDKEKITRYHHIICKDINFKDSIELKKEIQYLKLCILREKRNLNDLRRQEPFSLEDKFEDGNWIQLRKNKMQTKINFLQRNIENKSRLIKHYKSFKN